jgi:hypothetical protein
VISDVQNPLKGSRFAHPDAFAGRCDYVEAISFAVLGIIGVLDYITGYEFGFFIFYFIPVAISSWYCGRRLGLQVAFGSAIVWYLSDKFTHHPYSHSYFIYWEMFMRLLSFLTTTFTISRIREMVLNEERLLAKLISAEKELEQLKNGKDRVPDAAPASFVTTELADHGSSATLNATCYNQINNEN